MASESESFFACVSVKQSVEVISKLMYGKVESISFTRRAKKKKKIIIINDLRAKESEFCRLLSHENLLFFLTLLPHFAVMSKTGQGGLGWTIVAITNVLLPN